MERMEWKLDRCAGLPPGPWKEEMDKIQWPTASGLPGLIVRNHMGALCGYVGVPKGHPMYEMDYEQPNVDVHGGLTFAGKCGDSHEGICHIAPPEEDDVWWLGFDCAHYDDLCPSGWSNGEYRDMAYVTSEVERLAEQLV